MPLNEMLGIYTTDAPANGGQPSDAVLPEWENTTLSEISHIRTGPFGTLLKASEYSELDGVPMISVREVGHGKLRVDEHTPLIPREVVKRLPEYLLKEGDVIFGRKGAVDRSALVSIDEEGWFLGSDGIRVRLKDGFHPPFFAAQFQSRSVQQWLLQNATGTTMASLNQEVLGRVRLHVPPFYEQNAIASALKDIDDLIASLDALIAKKRDIKQAAMQQLLTGKTRLPGFDGEWEAIRLGEIADFVAGGTPRTDVPAYWGGAVPWMSSGELHQKRVIGVSGRITELGLKRSAAKMIPSKSVLVGLAGQGRTRGTVAINEIELTTNQSIAAIIPNKRIDPYFLYHNIDSRYDELRFLSSGDGGRGGLNLAILKGLEISLPSRQEQQEISNILNELDVDRTISERKLQKLLSLKEGMMQQLLTGRIRLV